MARLVDAVGHLWISLRRMINTTPPSTGNDTRGVHKKHVTQQQSAVHMQDGREQQHPSPFTAQPERPMQYVRPSYTSTRTDISDRPDDGGAHARPPARRVRPAQLSGPAVQPRHPHSPCPPGEPWPPIRAELTFTARAAVQPTADRSGPTAPWTCDSDIVGRRTQRFSDLGTPSQARCSRRRCLVPGGSVPSP